MPTTVTIPDMIATENNPKQESKIKVPTIKLKGIEKEMSKCLNEIIKQNPQFEALEINRKSDLISATPATFFQGRRLVTRTSEVPRNIRLQRQRSMNNGTTGGGSMSSRLPCKEDDGNEAESLLRKLFQNELIQAQANGAIGNGEIKPSMLSTENNHFPVTKPKRLNSARTAIRMSQMGASKPVVTFKKYKLFEENTTKTEFPRILTKETMEMINNNENTHMQEGPQRLEAISNFVIVNRVNTENGEENTVLARAQGRSREVKSLGNINGRVTERKVEAEGGVMYLRSKSTGNMVRLNNGPKSLNDLSKAKNYLDEAKIAGLYSIMKTNGDPNELKDTSIMDAQTETEIDYYLKQVSLSKLA